jgi:biopolymer transport protein ExbD
MGEVDTEQNNGGQEKGLIKKGKKLSTRVDMTPVVDLAFLLLTFFMLATTFNKPQVMEMILPEKMEEDETRPMVNENNVLTIILGEANKIYWFTGITDPKVETTDYSPEGIRKVLQEHTQLNRKLVVLVKPDEGSTYENFVDMFDELTITKPSSFALDELNDDDRALIEKYAGGKKDIQEVGEQSVQG